MKCRSSIALPPRQCRRARRAFSLIELMVAVALMTVIMLGLLAMFYQTQRALRLASTQVDVLETGRSTLQLLTTELMQTTAFQDTNVFNLIVEDAPFGPLVQNRPDGTTHVNVLQDVFFLTQENDDWIGTGYFVEAPYGGVGTLHRWTRRVSGPQAFNLYQQFRNDIQNNFPTNFHRVAERVIHLQLRPHDGSGFLVTNSFTAKGFAFVDDQLPARVDLEFGVLEPKAWERFKNSVQNQAQAQSFLAGQLDKVHFFRQRVPIRTAR